MAEFSEVMHNIQRRCNLCGQGEKFSCTIEGSICSRMSGMPYNADWSALEKEVMAWAAEHPEPVYPSIAKYLEQFGIMIRRDGSLQAHFFKAHEPMSAEMAKLLGISSMEGENEKTD